MHLIQNRKVCSCNFLIGEMNRAAFREKRKSGGGVCDGVTVH